MKRYFIFLLFFILAMPVQAENSKYPDFGKLYLGVDKYEKFNRKMFNANLAINKYAIRPITIIWKSILPKYGIERLKFAYNNILYPRRVVSALIQKDFKAAGRTTARFIVNSSAGLGGMFDPAKRFLKIKPVNEDMEQALAKLKVKSGPYLVVPILNSTTPRGLFGYALDSALDPTSYVGSYVIAAIKACFTINNAAASQKGIKTVLNGYIDPYDIARKAYGLKSAILNSNLDRDEVIDEKDNVKLSKNEDYIFNVADIEALQSAETIKGSTSTDEILYDEGLIPDIILKNFNSKHPVADSMRTALFNIEGVEKSFWEEDSIWNMSFKEKIKTASVNVTEGRYPYKFKYIMQKDKTSPVAIIYPSIGEGINSHHSVHFAKLLYDKGYSVVIQGSAFHYDFYNSMPVDYRPGLPLNDAKYLRQTTGKIIDFLQEKYNCKFKDKIVMGTSYGAISTLFLGDLEEKEHLLNISKFISINPPIELIYAMNEIDKNSEDYEKDENNLKEKTNLSVAKVIQKLGQKQNGENIEELPFEADEAKLITGFVMHQKLSDLMYAIENVKEGEQKEFYENMNNTSYSDYAKKYLTDKNNPTLDALNKKSSLHYIKDYLQNSKNYIIYHSLDDYLVNYEQLKKLKSYSGKKMRLIDKGAHLGFLYREEFLDDFKKQIQELN